MEGHAPRDSGFPQTKAEGMVNLDISFTEFMKFKLFGKTMFVANIKFGLFLGHPLNKGLWGSFPFRSFSQVLPGFDQTSAMDWDPRKLTMGPWNLEVRHFVVTRSPSALESHFFGEGSPNY